MVVTLRRHSGKRSSHRWSWKVVEGAMLGNKRRSIMGISTLYWTYILILIFWTKGRSPLQNQRIIHKGKVLTTSLDLITKSLNRKQEARFAITDITKYCFRKLLKKFDDSPSLGYKIKQVHNGPTEAYFFLIKQITMII